MEYLGALREIDRRLRRPIGPRAVRVAGGDPGPVHPAGMPQEQLRQAIFAGK